MFLLAAFSLLARSAAFAQAPSIPAAVQRAAERYRGDILPSNSVQPKVAPPSTLPPAVKIPTPESAPPSRPKLGPASSDQPVPPNLERIDLGKPIRLFP